VWRYILLVVGSGVLLVWGTAEGAEVFYQVPISELKIVDAAMPNFSESSLAGLSRGIQTAFLGRAVMDGDGEAYISRRGFSERRPAPDDILAVRMADGSQEPSGRLYLFKTDGSGLAMLRFTVPRSAATADARVRFYQAKADYYRELLREDIPGAAWFRHQYRDAIAQTGEKVAAPDANVPPVPVLEPDASELERTFELFSGGRAISENLQLDRALLSVSGKGGMVRTDSIPGITIREIDWKPLLGDACPELDPLASLVPADQHVVFFPSFAAAVRLADEAEAYGTPVLELAQSRSESAQCVHRYQRQLGLWSTTITRLLGPHVVRSVVLTGSDTYYPTGTDVAVLLEATEPAALEQLVLARVYAATAGEKDVRRIEGRTGPVTWHGVRSPDRTVSSYVARLGQAVVVTNSPYQLERLAAVAQGQAKPIASLPEYRFFRKRYPRGEAEETAFVFLSDATIRRWCGPRWRIGNSRRTRDAAVLAELQAAHMDSLARNQTTPGPLSTDFRISWPSELRLTERGVLSSTIGSLGFLTPIAELPLDEVTRAEAQAYSRWRDGYQQNWRWAFDPIAMRIVIREDRLATDITVMPLIWATDYRSIIELAQGVHFAPYAGDPHDALVHAVVALNPKSQPVRWAGNFLSAIGEGLTLSWLGSSAAFYADRDPIWAEFARQKPHERERFVWENLERFPVAVRFEVSNRLRLTAALAAVRAFIEQTDPGMTLWEPRQWRDRPYVKVSATAKAKRQPGGRRIIDEAALYYMASGDTLLITFSEGLLRRAIDRDLARQSGKAGTKDAANGGASPPQGQSKVSAAATVRPWLGTTMALRVAREAIELAALVGDSEYRQTMKTRAWANLPILNEWKRRYPSQDPIALHRRVWHTDLLCPGGGKYVWNERWQTMESTVYGHPGEPKPGPAAPLGLLRFQEADFGVTLEEQGLRARVELRRGAQTLSKTPAAQRSN